MKFERKLKRIVRVGLLASNLSSVLSPPFSLFNCDIIRSKHNCDLGGELSLFPSKPQALPNGEKAIIKTRKPREGKPALGHLFPSLFILLYSPSILFLLILWPNCVQQVVLIVYIPSSLVETIKNLVSLSLLLNLFSHTHTKPSIILFGSEYRDIWKLRLLLTFRDSEEFSSFFGSWKESQYARYVKGIHRSRWILLLSLYSSSLLPFSFFSCTVIFFTFQRRFKRCCSTITFLKRDNISSRCSCFSSKTRCSSEKNQTHFRSSSQRMFSIIFYIFLF